MSWLRKFRKKDTTKNEKKLKEETKEESREESIPLLTDEEVKATVASASKLYAKPRVWAAFKEQAKTQFNDENFEFYEMFRKFKENPTAGVSEWKKIYDYIYNLDEDNDHAALNISAMPDEEIKKVHNQVQQNKGTFNKNSAVAALELASKEMATDIGSNNLAKYPNDISLDELNECFKRSEYYQTELVAKDSFKIKP